MTEDRKFNRLKLIKQSTSESIDETACCGGKLAVNLYSKALESAKKAFPRY